MVTQMFTVSGMHCGSCGMLIDETLEELRGVTSSSTSVRRASTKVQFDPATANVKTIVKAIKKLGYSAEPV